MNDKNDSPSLSKNLEAIREKLQSTRLLPRPTRKTTLTRTCPSHGEVNSAIGQELSDFCTIGEDILLCDASEATKIPKPFAGFGSYRQVHGESVTDIRRSSNMKVGFSSEAPAKLGRDYNYLNNVTQSSKDASTVSFEHGSFKDLPEAAKPVDIARKTNSGKAPYGRPRLQKQKSWSTDVNHDEAWERKKDLHSTGSLNTSHDFLKGRKIGRSVSDCCNMIASDSHRGTCRTNCLTDEDLDELRGCIDLGFDLSNQSDPKMWDTFPALELCYAISQQLKNEQSRSSPVSVLADDALDSSASASNASAPPSARLWMISSPGDHPQVVKDRLRHWAQAVGFTVRQTF